MIPSYVGGYAIVAALGPRGILQRWLEPLGVNRLPEIYGFFGAWLALTLFTYPYVLVTVRASLRRLDPAFEDAARSLGSDRRRTFFHVILPALRPSIAAGALLVALYTLHDFGAVSLLRFDSFTRAIYVSYGGSFDRSRAAVLALVLSMLALVVLWLEARTRGRAAFHRAHSSAQRPPATVSLGSWKWPAFALVVLLVVISLAMPLGVIVYWLVRSVRASAPLGPTVAAAAASLRVAGIAALVAVVAAWPVALLSARHPGPASRVIERASYSGYALPGIVVALSLVFFSIRVTPPLYQSIAVLLFAYVVLFLPQAVGALRASFLQVGPSIEEAARSLGAKAPRRTFRVLAPLVRPGALAGAALVFLTVMKELPATLLLAPIGFRTLATEVWSAANAAFLDRAAVPAIALVLVASLPLSVLAAREDPR